MPDLRFAIADYLPRVLSDMYVYDNLDARDIINDYDKRGEVRLVLTPRRAKACAQMLKLLDIAIQERVDSSTTIFLIKKIYWLVYSLLFGSYILVMHSGLIELIGLYSRIKPKWSYEKQGSGKYEFIFKNPRETVSNSAKTS